MRPLSHRLPDLRPALAILWGLALLWPGTPDVDRLRPLCVAAAMSIGLAALLRPRAEGLRLTAVFSLGMAAIMAWQPLYSTLGYSFLLNLHWQAWLLGLGLLGWQAAEGGPAAATDPEASSDAAGLDGAGRPARGRAAGRRRRWARVAAALALGGALGLRLWPGAGMVERSGAAGLLLLAWGLALHRSLRAPGR